VRGLLFRTLGKQLLPNWLQPQPSIIVVDQAEELLRKHRAEFLRSFHPLIKEARDCNYFKLVFVVNSEVAVKSFEAFSDSSLYIVANAAAPDRTSVENVMRQEFPRMDSLPIYDKCGGNLGAAIDYLNCRNPEELRLTPEEFYAKTQARHRELHDIQSAVSAKEYCLCVAGRIAFP
jgi:hypothetical protein